MLGRIGGSLSQTMRGKLILLAAALAVPASFLGTLLVYDAHSSERAAIDRQLSETARALSLVVDRQLGQSEALLMGLASSPYLRRGELEAFHAQAAAAVSDDRWVVLADARGQQRLNTYVPFGQPLPELAPHQDYVDTVAERAAHVSNLRASAVHPQKVVSVAIPVSVRGQPHALALVMLPSALATALADQNLPDNWVATILDREGFVVARNRMQAQFVGAPATADLRQAMTWRASGVMESVNLEGVESIIAYSRSPNSGWTVVVGAPRAELLASGGRLLLLAVAAAFSVLLTGIVLSGWMARRIVRSVDALSRAAAALGRGELPPLTRTGIRETDQVAAVLHDSAQRLKAREEELKRLNETLEARVAEATETLVQARKLEAVGRLTGGVAHDFNNLLTAVRVNLDLLARRVSDEKLLRMINSARHATERGATLTAQLLAFARKQRLAPEPVDVNKVVEVMGDLLRSTLGGAVRVEPSLAAGLPEAFADRTQLELIIMNLAINARDAMPPGGLLRIETAREEVTARSARPEHPEPGSYVVVTVADTGSGMPPEVLARVFEPFFTTKPVGRGSGLGLSQVLGVVKQLGGGLRIDSRQGEGTRVSVYLPLVPAGYVPEAQAEDERASYAGLQGLKVLLVDDDPSVRAATAELLRDLSCVVKEADSGETALGLMDAGASVDVALVDYAMPGMTGSELADQLRQRDPSLRVLLMSGFISIESVQQEWAASLLRKPFTKDELARRLSDTLQVAA